MRWLFLTLIMALGVLAFVDLLGRTQPLMVAFPARGQLQFVDITLAGLNSAEVCRAQRRGGTACRWVMSLEADDARSWQLMLEPLLDRQDHRYALLQPGDRLRLGLFQERVYALQRLAANATTPGLEATATLLSEATLYDWRYRWLAIQMLWLVLDVLVIAVSFYLLWRRQRLITFNQQLLAHVLVLTVLASMLWSWRPQPLPEERALVDLPVRFFAIGERLDCMAGWSRVTRCQPQRFLQDDQARIWPLAYSTSHSLSIDRGAELELGMHGDKVYRITYPMVDVGEPAKCVYRQNPMARRTQVIWICEDALEAIERGRQPLAALQEKAKQQIAELKRFPPMPYDWTEQAYLEARTWHNRLIFLVLLVLGIMFVLGLLLQRPIRVRS